MKVLIQDKIVDNFSFPITEALSFSILVWTLWGFAEAFFWERFVPFVEPTAEKPDPWIYMGSFLVYISVAVVMGLLAYLMVRLTLFSSEKSENSALFRGATLATILGFFFVFVLGYHLPYSVAVNGLSTGVQYTIMAVSVLFSVAATITLFRKASALGFRIRRSGSTMFSILALSLVFSLVRFPIFSGAGSSDRAAGLRHGMQKLTVYHYVSALLPGDTKN